MNFVLSGPNYSTDTLRDMLAVINVIHKFDLPLCRVAMRINLNIEMKIANVINASSFEGYKVPSKIGRREKYEARRRQAISAKVPSLQLSVLYKLISNLCLVF